MPAFLAVAPPTDARIEDLTIGFQDYQYRAPYMFGGREVDRVTLLNVRCRLGTKSGKSAEGAASMSLGNVWSFPAPPYDTTLGAEGAGRKDRPGPGSHRIRPPAG